MTFKGSVRALLLGQLLLVVALTSVAFVTAKKDRNQPHAHKGILKPYTPGSFGVALSKKEEKDLAEGKSVMKQSLPTASSDGSDAPPSGGVLCVQDVDAPVEAVWYQILNLNDYTAKVAKLRSSKNYVEKQNAKDKTVNIKTKMVLSAFPGYSFESYYDHTYYPDKSSLTWRLDYDKTSDFDDVSGHWHVEGLGEKKSRVFYACDVQMSGPIPTPLMNYIGKQALKQATSWVKKESEANPTLAHAYTPKTTTTKSIVTASTAVTSPRGGVSLDCLTSKLGRFASFSKPKW
eukprot:CAMPEP_0198141746 /NCGR_PEP_ID=MMETSP1443-20131203/4688_1 /TAXON_ID=186043 /ORGANISM="Entomoneis sp., Strain CCMP2396" /LENGTH=289 /DNA_ID=CAMNT_0043804575 /DNA_START=87 /DNA_END=953 /DNA_ORIENTATION=+